MGANNGLQRADLFIFLMQALFEFYHLRLTTLDVFGKIVYFRTNCLNK